MLWLSGVTQKSQRLLPAGTPMDWWALTESCQSHIFVSISAFKAIIVSFFSIDTDIFPLSSDRASIKSGTCHASPMYQLAEPVSVLLSNTFLKANGKCCLNYLALKEPAISSRTALSTFVSHRGHGCR